MAVHTDGTVFSLDYSNYGLTCCSSSGQEYQAGTISVVGIAPTTGSQQLSVGLDESTSSYSSSYTFLGGFCPGSALPMDTSTPTTSSAPTVLSGPIIAGDGYAYIAYEYQNQTTVNQRNLACNGYSPSGVPQIYESDTTTTDTVVHLMLMRVGTDGSSSKIDVKDWESQYVSQFSNFPGSSVNAFVSTSAVPAVFVSIITNADQGTALGWEADAPQYCASGTASPYGCNAQVQAASTYGFATTMGSGLASSNSESTAFWPVLQAQDGSFYGTDDNGNLVHATSSGSPLWSVPNDSPQIATADDGVIGTSGTTYDSNGNATGQIVLPTQSWTGNGYQVSVSQVIQVPTAPAAVATPAWSSFNEVNQSANGTSPICNDGLLQIVAQYGQYRVGDAYFRPLPPPYPPNTYPQFTPNCFEFAIPPSNADTIYTPFPAAFTFAGYRFADLSDPTNSAGALIKNPLVVPSSSGYGLAEWVVTYGATRSINSAYRTPPAQFFPICGWQTGKSAYVRRCDRSSKRNMPKQPLHKSGWDSGVGANGQRGGWRCYRANC